MTMLLFTVEPVSKAPVVPSVPIVPKSQKKKNSTSRNGAGNALKSLPTSQKPKYHKTHKKKHQNSSVWSSLCSWPSDDKDIARREFEHDHGGSGVVSGEKTVSTGKGNDRNSSAGKTREADSENHYRNLKSRRMARQSGQVPCPGNKNQRLSVIVKEKIFHSGKSLASGTESALASLVDFLSPPVPY